MSDQPQPSPPSPQQGIKARYAAGVLVMIVLAVYLPSFRGGFVWDDTLLIDQNPLVKGEFTLRTVWFSTDFPLSNVALWAEWRIFGQNAIGYRFVNAALHAVSCVLLWRLLARLKIPGAWLAAALFAAHPVAVGSVAWVSEIKNTLSLPFYLLSFGWYLDFEDRHGSGEESPARICYALSLLAFVLALLTKTSTVMLPVVLLLTAWWRRGRLRRCDLFQTTPHFLLALAFGLMTVWFQTQQTLATFSLPPESFPVRLAGAGMAMWFYLGKALLPLNLCAIYPRWEINPGHALVYGPLALLLAGVAVGWWRKRTWGRHGLFALGCFAANLFPALGCFDMYFLLFSRVSDHFQYLALIAPLAAVSAGLSLIRQPVLFRSIVMVLLVGLGLLGVQRARIFTADEALWRDTLAKNPAAWTAHNNLGCILAEKGDLAGAQEHFTVSLKLNPRNASAHCNLGRARLLKNDFAGAEKHFLAALEIKPDHADTLKNYGVALAEHGRATEAIGRLREAVRLKPDAATRRQLAVALSSLGRDAEAVQELRLALASQPNSREVMQSLAWLLATSADGKVRNGADAVRLAEQACQRTQEKDALMLGTLAAAQAEAGHFEDATRTAMRAIEVAQANGNPSFARLNAQLLQLYQAGKPYRSPTSPR